MTEESQAHHGFDELPAPNDPDLFAYRATIDPFSNHELGVIDGDTFDVLIDRGMGDFAAIRVRPYHIDTGEINVKKHSEEWERGQKHKRFAREWMERVCGSDPVANIATNSWPLKVRTRHSSAGWSRWMADVYAADGESYSQAIFQEFGEEVLQDGRT